jgi:RNA-binding protein
MVTAIMLGSMGGYLNTLKGFQRKYLRGLAHGLKPVVSIGQKGMTDAIIQSVDEAIQRHELIKVKFVDYKQKDQKMALANVIEQKTGADMVGMIGHVGIFYRAHEDPEKRRIELPERKA